MLKGIESLSPFSYILAAMSLVEYRPSAIAAAAILAVSDERLTQESLESKMRSILECGVLDTVSC